VDLSYLKNISEKKRFDHVFESYCSFWNHALNFIATRLGEAAVDEHIIEVMGPSVLGATAFEGISKQANHEEVLKRYVEHHEMLGSAYRVLKVEKDEIIVDIVRCASKAFLVEKFGGDKTRFYCRHCEILPLWKTIGWRGTVDYHHAAADGGQNIGCRRILSKEAV
jgi:hypothetical protein